MTAGITPPFFSPSLPTQGSQKSIPRNAAFKAHNSKKDSEKQVFTDVFVVIYLHFFFVKTKQPQMIKTQIQEKYKDNGEVKRWFISFIQIKCIHVAPLTWRLAQ